MNRHSPILLVYIIVSNPARASVLESTFGHIPVPSSDPTTAVLRLNVKKYSSAYVSKASIKNTSKMISDSYRLKN